MKKIKYILIFLGLVIINSCTEDTLDVEVKGTLTGTVSDKESGDPLEGVKITTNPASTTVFSLEDGTFSIPNILVDDYSVQAELDDYNTAFEPIAITEGDTSVVIIEMELSGLENDPPLIPMLISPEDNAEDVPLEVEFVWSSSANDDDDLLYTLELRNGATGELTRYEVEQDTMYTVENLRIATNYFWQVKVTDEVNEEVSSSINTFRTLTFPNNPFLFVKEEDGNNIIFSGNQVNSNTSGETDIDVIQLTSSTTNSFRPRKNNAVNKIAFLRTIGSETHLFTMNFDGTDVQQVTSTVPVSGFRLSEIRYTWANNGGSIVYPNFDKLYSIDPDGGDSTLIYQTPDGSLISEIAIPDFDQDLLMLKTNNSSGYDVRVFTYRLSTASEEVVLVENVPGAIGSIDITANAERALFSMDRSGSENPEYRRFDSRIFLYNFNSAVSFIVETDVIPGEVEYDSRFSPTEGGMIWTRRGSNTNSIPDIFSKIFLENIDKKLFTNSIMPDWE